MWNEEDQHPFPYLRRSSGARSLQSDGFANGTASPEPFKWWWIIISFTIVFLSIVLLAHILRWMRNFYLSNKELAKLQFVRSVPDNRLTAEGWPKFEPKLDLLGYPDLKWIDEFGSSSPPLWNEAAARGGQNYNGSLHGENVNREFGWKLNILGSTSSDALPKFLERRLVISYPHVRNSMHNKARWKFRGEEGVNSTRTPVARNVLESDVKAMQESRSLHKIWFDGAAWPKWAEQDPETAANGLCPYVLDGSYVGIHVATPSQLDYGLDAFDGMSPGAPEGTITRFHELQVWFQYVARLHELAECDTPPAVLPPWRWPIIYKHHERFWMLAEACAGILHTRIDFMPQSKRRVAEMIRTMNFLLDPGLERRMAVARNALDKASKSCWSWITGKKVDIPTVPSKEQIKLAQIQLAEKLAMVSRWAALTAGVSGQRPRRAMLAAFLEPMATADCSKQSDRITVFAMLAYLFEHVYGGGLGPMEALRKYETQDDKLYRAWECMSGGSVLVPDGFTTDQVARLERNYLLEVFDVDVADLSYIKIGARFSMPVSLPGRGFMGSMSITPWKPLFLRALWRCRGLAKEVDTTPGSSRDDRVENGTYTEFLEESQFQMRMRHMEDFHDFVTGLQKWYLPLVSTNLPWCWDEPTRVLVVPVVDTRQLREMKPDWDGGVSKVLRVHMTDKGIFPRVHGGIDETYDLSEQVTIWQFAFQIPLSWLGKRNLLRKPRSRSGKSKNRTNMKKIDGSPEGGVLEDHKKGSARDPFKTSSSRGGDMSGVEPRARHGGEENRDPQVSGNHEAGNFSQTKWNQEQETSTTTMAYQDESPQLITARIGFLAFPWGVHTVMGPKDIDWLHNGIPEIKFMEGTEQIVLNFKSYVEGPMHNRVVPGEPVERDYWSDVKMINKAPANPPKVLYGLPANCDNLYGEKWTGEEENTAESKQGWLGVNFRKFECGFDTAMLWSPEVEWL